MTAPVPEPVQEIDIRSEYKVCAGAYASAKDAWNWLEKQPVLETLCPAASSFAQAAAERAGLSLESVDLDYVTPLLARMDAEYVDGAVRATVDLWSFVLRRIAADMLVRHVAESLARAQNPESSDEAARRSTLARCTKCDPVRNMRPSQFAKGTSPRPV
eukprot:CAMPEP_0184237474 /NCGR_PEP_ID=MMETSP0976-20121227/26373_1 /TAXON_ID=483370 /ORGANISM="non described non described, Strain CCMP2097" /LENGTH=158 /DNA_ID=CAMNT_0026542629 /DNA_START=45 /DNA_END=522 /DNA_ORIENTATION=-